MLFIQLLMLILNAKITYILALEQNQRDKYQNNITHQTFIYHLTLDFLYMYYLYFSITILFFNLRIYLPKPDTLYFFWQKFVFLLGQYLISLLYIISFFSFFRIYNIMHMFETIFFLTNINFMFQQCYQIYELKCQVVWFKKKHFIVHYRGIKVYLRTMAMIIFDKIFIKVFINLQPLSLCKFAGSHLYYLWLFKLKWSLYGWMNRRQIFQ